MKVRASVAFLILLLGYTTAKAGQPPGTWQPAHDMNESRASHTATLLADGTVLVAGGYQFGSGSLASAERYDPLSDT